MNHLGLFAKYWQPGTVKTRLAVSIGDQAACDLYHAFVFHLLDQLSRSADERTVVFSPQERALDFRKSVPSSWKLCPQSSGCLGTRMSSFFRRQFEPESTLGKHDTSARKVVIIGADCPQIDPDLIQSAFQRLDETPVVIGPSNDGGYYLIAMREVCFEVFSGIEWSTDTVYKTTVQRMQDRGIQFQTLPVLTDVDDLESLMSLKSELENRSSHGSTSSKRDSQRPAEPVQGLLESIRTAIAGPLMESE